MQISNTDAPQKLKAPEKTFQEISGHGTLGVEIYKLRKKNLQLPHERDEVNIIISGTREFINGNIKTKFEPGDFIFVPAGVELLFLNFTNNFST